MQNLDATDELFVIAFLTGNPLRIRSAFGIAVAWSAHRKTPQR